MDEAERDNSPCTLPFPLTPQHAADDLLRRRRLERAAEAQMRDAIRVWLHANPRPSSLALCLRISEIAASLEGAR